MTWLNVGLVVFYTAGGGREQTWKRWIYFDRPLSRGAVDAVFKPRRFLDEPLLYLYREDLPVHMMYLIG